LIPHRRSRNDAEHLARVHGLTFLDVQPLDGAAFGRANFILHFHSFDNEQALASFNGVTRLDENADDLAGHGSEHLLAAFGFERAMAPAAPRAGIEHLGGKFLQAGLEFEYSIRRRRDANFVRPTLQQK
jgi:hypothetical protein